jgi:hypothetical protein
MSLPACSGTRKMNSSSPTRDCHVLAACPTACSLLRYGIEPKSSYSIRMLSTRLFRRVVQVIERVMQ